MLHRLTAAIALWWGMVFSFAGAQEPPVDASATAVDPAPAAAPPGAAGARVVSDAERIYPRRVRGLLDVDLPRFDPPGTFNLQFNPRFRDLLKRGYIRVPTGVRWTLNDELELNVEAEAYISHGLKHSDAGHGLGELRFGARRLVHRWPQPEFETSFGLQLEFPVGSPPIDMTDGRNHVRPFIVTEHRYPGRPRWTEFAGVSIDFVSDSSVAGQIGSNTPKDDAISLTGGFVYDRGRLVWTIQGTYTTTLISGIDEHFFTVNPSVIWFVPRKYTFHSRTQWLVGFGVRSTWGPDGHDLSTGSRVRAEITFRQAVEKLRAAFEKQR